MILGDEPGKSAMGKNEATSNSVVLVPCIEGLVVSLLLIITHSRHFSLACYHRWYFSFYLVIFQWTETTNIRESIKGPIFSIHVWGWFDLECEIRTAIVRYAEHKLRLRRQLIERMRRRRKILRHSAFSVIPDVIFLSFFPQSVNRDAEADRIAKTEYTTVVIVRLYNNSIRLDSISIGFGFDY